MAKIKISELAKELGCDGKDLTSFLQKNGIEAAKRSTSSIEDGEADQARKHFGKAAGQTVEKKEEKTAEVKDEKKTAEHSVENEADQQPQKKKKKIIFVSNPGNSKIPGARPAQENHNVQRPVQNQTNNNGNGNSGRSRNGFSASQNAYHPIKPKTAPSQIENYNTVIAKTESKPVTVEKTPEVKETPVQKPINETAPVQEKAIEKAVTASTVQAQQTVQEHQAVEKPVSHPVSASTVSDTAARRPYNGGNRDGQSQGSYGNRQGGYNNNRTGQSQGSYGNRSSQGGQSQGGYNRSSQGGQSQGGYNRSSQGGQSQGGYNRSSQGGYNSQGGQSQGSYGNRSSQGGYNSQGGQGSYGNRSSQGGYNSQGTQGGQGSYGNRSSQGGYNSQGTQGGQGSYGNRSSQGGYNNRDGQSQGSYGNRSSQGGYNNRGGQGGQSQGGYGNRGGQGGGYNNRGGQGQGGGFSGRPSFGANSARGGQNRPGRQAGSDFADTPIKDAEKHRDEEKRRIGQEKDKRSRKDMVYEEDESKMPRSKRVGRFIRPEIRKVEEPVEQIKVISIPEKLTIKDLAEKMRLQPSGIIKKLFLSGKIVTVNSELSYEDAENIAIEYDIICEKEIPVDVIEELLKEDDDADETLEKRPPVVCVMGHVDHGKTSLLDAIRNTSVTSREAGGITQKIGAYTVSIQDQKITFLDTPGHEAFTAMRMRGANSTDIAVLVVAADDGVMPQTIEAINHAKAAKVEIIVAVNKIDKPNANIDRVKQEMTEYGLVATDWGGTTEFVPVSAKTGEGIDTLLETILLTADILELKSNPNRQARGLVLEAKLDKGRGPVANVLIQKGTLHVGDFISAGACSGKVRAMADDKGKRVKEALPSQPVEILGLSDVPNAGEVILGHESDKEAKQYADTYLQQHKKDLIDETKAKMSLDDLYSKIEEGKLKELDIIIKADVQGSVEALKQSLMKLSNEEVVVKVIHGGVGAINESDVTLAAASSAIIIGFDVRPDATAKGMAEREGVEIKLYKVIYQAIEDVDAAMKGMLAPVYEEKVLGHAEVRQIFKASSIGNIAGSFVTDGIMQKGCSVRIKRDGEQVFEGKLESLKRFKDDVKEVKEGYECGLVFEDFDQIQELDVVEAYTMVEVPRS